MRAIITKEFVHAVDFAVISYMYVNILALCTLIYRCYLREHVCVYRAKQRFVTIYVHVFQ